MWRARETMRSGRSMRTPPSRESPIGRYAGALAALVLGDDEAAARLGATLGGAEPIPPAVTDAITALAAHDERAYVSAIEALVADFEARDEFLEDIPVADTVLALRALAEEREICVTLDSPLVPPASGARCVSPYGSPAASSRRCVPER